MEQIRREVPTACYMCYCDCGVRAQIVDGVVVDIVGDANNPNSNGKICAKGQAGLMSLYDPCRVRKPLRRTNPEKGIGIDPKWQEISWEEALEEVCQRLKAIRDDDPRKLIVCGMDFQLYTFYGAFASAFGTPNVWKGGAHYFCGNGLHQVLYMTNGSFYSEIDLEHCNYCLIFGSQFGFMMMTDANCMSQRMAEARSRGMRVVVIDPLCTNAASKADEWVSIRPGTDCALALGLVNQLVNELGIYDREFLTKFTNAPYLIGTDGLYIREAASGKPLVWDLARSAAVIYDHPQLGEPAIEGNYKLEGGGVCIPTFQKLKDHVAEYSAEVTSEITGVPADTIKRVAREFGQAARIGSKCLFDGQELPLRPAGVFWNKGAQTHQALMSSFAIQLLNIVTGAIDVPGGLLGSRTVGPFWQPKAGPDGMIVPADFSLIVSPAYPARPVSPVRTLSLNELFPVACYSAPLFEEGILHPEQYGLDYSPEMMLHCHSNVMMSCSSPSRIAQVLEKIPFMVSMVTHVDETAEFADIVLPDAHYLERLTPFPSIRSEGVPAGPGYWSWYIGQPVISPRGQARGWVEVILEIADRVGFSHDLNTILNNYLLLNEPYKLGTNRKYSLEEITDLWGKSWCGPQYDLNFFKKHGVCVTRPKKPEEVYPRPFLAARIPIYLEHLLKAGEEVKENVTKMGLNWDLSDYTPLPQWRACASRKESPAERDLFPINYKHPFHTFCITGQNPWLDELAHHHIFGYRILLNRQTAQRKGITDGEPIWVESAQSKVSGIARLTECIHPEAVGIAGTFGHWAKAKPVARDKGAHFNALLPSTPEHIDLPSACVDCCAKVQVYKA